MATRRMDYLESVKQMKKEEPVCCFVALGFIQWRKHQLIGMDSEGISQKIDERAFGTEQHHVDHFRSGVKRSGAGLELRATSRFSSTRVSSSVLFTCYCGRNRWL